MNNTISDIYIYIRSYNGIHLHYIYILCIYFIDIVKIKISCYFFLQSPMLFCRVCCFSPIPFNSFICVFCSCYLI